MKRGVEFPIFICRFYRISQARFQSVESMETSAELFEDEKNINAI